MPRFASLYTWLLCGALMFAVPQSALSESEDEALTRFAYALPANIQCHITRNPARFLQSVAPLLFGISPDGIVTQELVTLKRDRRRADARAERIADILKYDTDGDGGLSAGELEALLPTLPAQERGKLSVFVIQTDADKDGDLTFTEILNAMKQLEKSINPSSSQNRIEIMAFDYNEDGKVDLAEIAKVVGAFDALGMDLNTMPVTPKAKPTDAQCKVPASDGAKGALVSLQTAQALSTITVAGQDRKTSVAVVTIGAGDEPLYIFATTDTPVIWKFEGATDRIQTLVLQPGMDEEPFAAAATGVERDRISFVPPGACARRAIRTRTGQDRYDILKLQGLLGVKFEHFALARAATHLSVP